MLELVLVGGYFIILVIFFFLIIKRVKRLNMGHAKETGIDALKYGCILIKRRMIIIFIALFLISTTIILNLI